MGGQEGPRAEKVQQLKLEGSQVKGAPFSLLSATPSSSHTPAPRREGVRATGAGPLPAYLVPFNQSPVLPLGSLEVLLD